MVTAFDSNLPFTKLIQRENRNVTSQPCAQYKYQNMVKLVQNPDAANSTCPHNVISHSPLIAKSPQ